MRTTKLNRRTTGTKTSASLPKKVVTSPDEAYNLFVTFMRKSPAVTYVNNSRARHATIREIASWYQNQYNSTLDAGWFGRSLNAAIKGGRPVSSISTQIKGRSVKLYRRS